MNEFRKNIYRTTTTVIIPPVLFSIESSAKDAFGQGTLDIVGGVPGETISLSFDMDASGTFNSLSFTAPVIVSVLDITHLNRTGTMLLDGSGNGSSTYTYDPTSATRACLVTVTARSSGDPTGIGYDTNIV